VSVSDPDWCEWHHRIEVESPDTFRVCGECGHVWNTAEELLDEFNREGERVERQLAEMLDGGRFTGDLGATDVADVLFCPLCLHDW
jgi:hypothetical protein